MPEVTSVVVAPAGRYYGGGAPIANSAPISLRTLSTMSSVDPGNCVTYQLSTDGGATYKWWNGAAWATTTAGAANSNYLVDFTAPRLAGLSAGDFKFKAFLNTNASFSAPCVLSQVGITYTGY